MGAEGGVVSASGDPAFDYGPGQPDLYRLMLRKQRLRADHGIADGFATYGRQFGFPAGAAPAPVDLVPLQAHASTRAAPYVETGASGIAFAHEPPDVFGDGNHRVVRGTTRTGYVACLRPATVRGRSNLLQVEGRLLIDAEPWERESLDDEVEWDPMVFACEGNTAWRIPSKSPVMELPAAFSLLGAHSDFFGHWMCEYLPKYAAARLSGALPAELPVLIDASMPPTHRQALALLYGADLPVVEVPALCDVHVAALWCAAAPSYWPLHELRNERFSWDAISASPERLSAPVRDMVSRARAAPGCDDAPIDRVFLARKSFRHRRLVNTREIEALAAERGFVVVYPEDHAFDAQVRLVAGASIILAPEGSAVFLAMFAPRGATLAILSHPLTDVLADYNTMFGALGVRTVSVTGPIERFDEKTPHDSDYRIEPGDLVRLLDRLGA